MVKKSRIMTLVLAAAVLAVVTSGMASAGKVTYSGEFVTTLASDGSVVTNARSNGDRDISSGDQLAWWYMFKNMKTSSKSAKMTQTTNPTGGLATESTSWTTVPAGDGINPGQTNDLEFVTNVNSYTSHTINCVHKYSDGTEKSSPTNSLMTYY